MKTEQMTPTELAEIYIKGFYCRPDGDNRDWDKYKEEEIKEFEKAFQLLLSVGGKVLQIQHCYSVGPVHELIVILDLELNERWEMEIKDEYKSWDVREFCQRFQGDQNNQVKFVGTDVNRMIVVESY